jgi:hypothetical protein
MLKKCRSVVCSLVLLISPSWTHADNHREIPQPTSADLVYELRTYTSHPGKLEALEHRFRNHTITLFEKHGIINISYWRPLDRPDTLIYLVAHPSKLDAAMAWQAFGNDPEWQTVYANSIANGRLVENIERTFMMSTDYSPKPNH